MLRYCNWEKNVGVGVWSEIQSFLFDELFNFRNGGK